MKIKPFRRSSTWSSKRALERIASKTQSVESEISRIDAEIAGLSTERLELVALKADLETPRVAETVRSEAHGRDSTSGPALIEFPKSSPEAGQSRRWRLTHSQVFDCIHRCFINPDRFMEGSSAPFRLRIDSDAPGERLVRLASLLNTPGLLHACAVGEAGQRVYGQAFEGLPPSCVGLGLLDRFIDQIFSTTIL